MGLFNKNDKDDRESLFKQIFHGASYEDAKAGVTAKNLILGILATLAILAVVIFGAVEIISSIAVALTEKHQETCEHNSGYDLETVYIKEDQKAAFACCKNCEKRLKIEATVKIESIEEATCVADGVRTEVWTFAGLPGVVHDKVYYTPKAEHVIGEYLYYRAEPSCKDDGRTAEGYCSWCRKRVGGDVIPKLECDFVRYGYKEATCYSTGMTGYEECKMCSTQRGENKVTPMLSHKAISGTFEATYENSAFIGEMCELCNTPLEIVEMKAEPKISEHFEYEIIDEEYIIINSHKKSEPNVMIPNRINGIPVRYLKDGLFENDKIIASVTLSNNLEELGSRVFKGCESLKEINIPDSVNSIGEECFMSCTNLRAVKTNNASIGNYAFAECIKLREIMLGGSVDSIGEYAFKKCVGIMFLRIETDEITVDDSAFYGVDSIYTLHFPVGLSSDIVRKSYKNYYYFNVSQNTKRYTVEADAYIGSTLGVKTLLAIDGTGSVAKIPDGIVRIDRDMMARSPWIDTLVIPKSVATIEKNHCDVRVNILYEGNEDEWSYVDYYGIGNIYSGGTVYVPISAEIYFYSQSAPENNEPLWHYDTDGKPVIY